MRAAVLLGVLAACETPPLTIDCEALTGEVGGAITTGAPAQPVTGDLTVRGMVSSTDTRVIRRVRVAGVAATNDDFNFETWSAVVPWSLLAGLPDSDAAGVVRLEAIAIDGCDGEHAVGTLEVTIERGAGAAR